MGLVLAATPLACNPSSAASNTITFYIFKEPSGAFQRAADAVRRRFELGSPYSP